MAVGHGLEAEERLCRQGLRFVCIFFKHNAPVLRILRHQGGAEKTTCLVEHPLQGTAAERGCGVRGCPGQGNQFQCRNRNGKTKA